MYREAAPDTRCGPAEGDGRSFEPWSNLLRRAMRSRRAVPLPVRDEGRARDTSTRRATSMEYSVNVRCRQWDHAPHRVKSHLAW